MTLPSAIFRLKIQKINETCLFELSWGRGQQLSAVLTYPPILSTLYQEWQRIYIRFYKSALRGRVEESGTQPSPPIDWHAKLVQAEAKLMYEFHRWLRGAELFEIRAQIAKGQELGEKQQRTADIFLTCEPLELARFPWEAWEIGTEFAAALPIRIARTPANIRAETGKRRTRGKARILVILGDDTGLNFQGEREAARSLSRIADIAFVGWQPGVNVGELKAKICATIADDRGWDVLFFAGHSNETEVTGGELAIAPRASLSIAELAPILEIAKQQGLQFALFNSCSGMAIASALIDLGLSQVAVMREPIHNRVAQEFLVQFMQNLADCQDVHDALVAACQFLKLKQNLTYPSAYLIPALFRHPDAELFRIEPRGWKVAIARFLPTPKEAAALAAILFLSWQLPVQQGLLEQRVLIQAIYRQLTGQIFAPKTPPVLLVQIDEKSIREAKISDPKPMNRRYLAQLVDKLSTLNAKIIGIDYLLDRPQEEGDRYLAQSLRAAVQKNNPTWFIFAAIRNDVEGWIGVYPAIASLNWSLAGDITLRRWYATLLPRETSEIQPLPFSYILALARQLNLEKASQVYQPSLKSNRHFLSQISASTQNPIISQRLHLHPVTAFSYKLGQMWLHPILDFSIPPDLAYQHVPAWKLLESRADSPELRDIKEQIAIVAAGGYGEAGVAAEGADNFTLPAAVRYWRDRETPPDPRRVFTGGEVHAYIIHHLLNNRLVVPIPDVWAIPVAAVLGKAVSLALKSRDRRLFRLAILFYSTPLLYGFVSLQVYISAALLLPWLFPSATICLYALPAFLRRKEYAKT